MIMSESYNRVPLRPGKSPRGPNYSLRRVVAGVSAIAIGIGVVRLADKYVVEPNRQPTCMLEAKPGDTVGGIVERVSQAGDKQTGTIRILDPTGRERNGLKAGDPYIGGSLGLYPGDTVSIERVNPNICGSLGGTVVGDGPSAEVLNQAD
jgi:hypothetical protein